MEEFLNKYKDLPAQRTKEWLEGRKSRVGSSETYDFVNDFNTFKTRKTSKEGFSNSYCVFGTLFENVAVRYLQEKWKRKVYDIGSLPHTECKYLSASPDGVIMGDGGKIELIEIKSPVMRRINKDIPPRYKYQMEMQLMCAPDAACVWFCDFEFRLKPRWNRHKLTFNRWFHKGRKSSMPDPIEVLEKGMIEVIDGKNVDYGAGERADYNKFKVDLTTIDLEDKMIFHKNIELDDMKYPYSSSFMYWQLNDVRIRKYVSDVAIREKIMQKIDEKASELDSILS